MIDTTLVKNKEDKKEKLAFYLKCDMCKKYSYYKSIYDPNDVIEKMKLSGWYIGYDCHYCKDCVRTIKEFYEKREDMRISIRKTIIDEYFEIVKKQDRLWNKKKIIRYENKGNDRRNI